MAHVVLLFLWSSWRTHACVSDKNSHRRRRWRVGTNSVPNQRLSRRRRRVEVRSRYVRFLRPFDSSRAILFVHVFLASGSPVARPATVHAPKPSSAGVDVPPNGLNGKSWTRQVNASPSRSECTFSFFTQSSAPHLPPCLFGFVYIARKCLFSILNYTHTHTVCSRTLIPVMFSNPKATTV